MSKHCIILFSQFSGQLQMPYKITRLRPKQTICHHWQTKCPYLILAQMSPKYPLSEIMGRRDWLQKFQLNVLTKVNTLQLNFFFHSEWFWGSNYQSRIFLFHNFLVLYFESDKSLFSTKITYAKKKSSIKNEQKGIHSCKPLIGIPLIT